MFFLDVEIKINYLFILDKLNYNIPLMSPESVLSSNGDNISSAYNQGSIKRPRTEDYSDVGLYQSSKPTNYLCSENRSYSRSKNLLIYYTLCAHNIYICTLHVCLCIMYKNAI